jgi:tetratricopeptide (TPR) repeat protein
MSEYFEYIDAYFQKELSDSEKKEFEQRCIDDPEFANDVAFYISSSAALKDVLLEQKKAEWSQLPIQQEIEPAKSSQAPVRQMNYKKWILYAAAACLIIAAISFPMLSSDSPQELADKYITEELVSISQTMDGSKDSMQSGMSAFNNKDYQTARQIFQDVYIRNPDNSDAIRYVGLTHLLTGNYEKAITSFDELSRKTAYSNPGLFLKAITLMKRNQGNDKQVAKGLLQKIERENLDGSKEAKKWLEKWPGE